MSIPEINKYQVPKIPEYKPKTTSDTSKQPEKEKKITEQGEKALGKKAIHEAEDITKHVTRPRSSSLPSIRPRSVVKTAQEEIAARSGHLWECIGRRPNKLGGFIYQLRVRDEFDDNVQGDALEKVYAALKKKDKVTFPALESRGSELIDLLDPSNRKREDIEKRVSANLKSFVEDGMVISAYRAILIDQIRLQLNEEAEAANPISQQEKGKSRQKEVNEGDVIKKMKEILGAMSKEEQYKRAVEATTKQIRKEIVNKVILAEIFYDAGFSIKVNEEGAERGVFLELPDREALLANWKIVKEKHPKLHELDIISLEGVASDQDFIDAYVSHDFVLSSGVEFVHDHTMHIIPLIRLIASYGDDSIFNKERKRVVVIVLNGYRRILMKMREIEENKLNIPKSELKLVKQQMNRFQALLSAFIDGISANEAPSEIRSLSMNLLNKWITNTSTDATSWGKYFRDKFGKVQKGEIQKIWEEMGKMKDEG